jgi:hypothetical protein
VGNCQEWELSRRGKRNGYSPVNRIDAEYICICKQQSQTHQAVFEKQKRRKQQIWEHNDGV